MRIPVALTACLAIPVLASCEEKPTTGAPPEDATPTVAPIATPTPAPVATPTAESKPPMNWTTSYPGKNPGEWFPRPLPLTELAITNTISANDFGAVPDDGLCDAANIRKALLSLRDAPGTKLVFDKGTYNLKSSTDDSRLESYIFDVQGLKDVQIDFGGSLMLIGRPQSGFMSALRCENVIIENMELDYAPLPYTVGKVVAIDRENLTFDFKILNGYPMPDDSFFLDYINRPGDPTTRTWGFFLDEHHPGRIKPSTRNVYFQRQVDKVSDGVYRYHVSWPGRTATKAGPDLNLDGVAEGDLFNYLARCSGAFLVRGNKQMTFRNIVLFASGGANVSGTYNDCMNFLGVHVRIKEGRYKTSNADGFIFHSLGYAPWFEGCTTEGMSDDTINIHIRPCYILEVLDLRTLRLGKEPAPHPPISPRDFAVGDDIDFFDGESGRITLTAKVTEVRPDESVVVFDRDLTGLKPGTEKLKSTSLYNSARSRGAVIRNNHFGGARRFGILLRAHDVLIENNMFEGLSSDAISVSNESPWPEGLFAKNILIRNNTFKDCGFEHGFITDSIRGVINFHCHLPPKPLDYVAHQNIVIEGNRFVGWYRRAILISNAGDVVIRNNTFDPPREPLDPSYPNEAAIVVRHSEDVVLEGNHFPPGIQEVAR